MHMQHKSGHKISYAVGTARLELLLQTLASNSTI